MPLPVSIDADSPEVSEHVFKFCVVECREIAKVTSVMTTFYVFEVPIRTLRVNRK